MGTIRIKATKLFYANHRAKKPIVINKGGARSGKSYAILQLLALYFLTQEKKRILVCRKTRPALKISCWQTFLDILEQWKWSDFVYKNMSDLNIARNGNVIYFRSIDKISKMKSTEFNYIFMEECDEMTYEDYQILKIRLSAPTKPNEPNKMFLAYNPVMCWVQEKIENNPNEMKNVEIIKSNYKDNPFLSKEYIQTLESLKDVDEEYWKIYGLGEDAVPTNTIYPKIETISNYDEIQPETIIYGLDFGYNNPTALIEIKIKDGVIYEKELLYQTGLTNADLIERLKELIKNKRAIIYADSSEPQRIEEIYKAGFNIKPAAKSVKDGIDFVKRQKILLDINSQNLIKEKKNYKWRSDKNGNIMDEPVKFNDHLMDAERYAIYTYFTENQIKSSPKLFDIFIQNMQDISRLKSSEFEYE